MRNWCKNGSRVNCRVTSVMANNYFMRAFYKQRRSGKTPCIRHVNDKTNRKQASSGQRFTYQELFLFAMPYLRSEETPQLAEHEYGVNEHEG